MGIEKEREPGTAKKIEEREKQTPLEALDDMLEEYKEGVRTKAIEPEVVERLEKYIDNTKR